MSGFLGGLFLRGMKNKKTKFKNKTTKSKKEERPQDAHKKTTLSCDKKQHRNKIIQVNSLKGKETTQEKQTKTKT